MEFNYNVLTIDELVRMVSCALDLSPREKALLHAVEKLLDAIDEHTQQEK